MKIRPKARLLLAIAGVAMVIGYVSSVHAVQSTSGRSGLKKLESLNIGGRLSALTQAFPSQLPLTPGIILRRERLGNRAEDMEVISTGLYKGEVVMIDGADVVGIRLDGKGRPHKLFSIRLLPLNSSSKGIGYIASEHRFVFNDPTQPDTLILSDGFGVFAGKRTIKYPSGFAPVYNEAINYIGSDSPYFPDHLADVAYDGDGTSHILIMRRDGTVEADIVPNDEAIQQNGVQGMGFVAPDKFIIGSGDSIFLIDLNGNIVSGPVTIDGQAGFEGVAGLKDGRYLATTSFSGIVFTFDGNFSRLTAADLYYKVGIGISLSPGLAWDSASRELLFERETALGDVTLEAVPTTLDSRHTIADLGADGVFPGDGTDLTYLPDEDRVGVVLHGEKSIALYDSGGVRTETIDLSPIGRPEFAQYLLVPHQFAVERLGQSNVGIIKFLDRNGGFVRQIDIGIPAITPMAYTAPSDPSGGQLLLFMPTNMETIDLNGQVLTHVPNSLLLFNYPYGITAITDGPYAGCYAVFEFDTATLEIFRPFHVIAMH